MPFCRSCGRDNSDSTTFCPQCGAQQAGTAAPMIASLPPPYVPSPPSYGTAEALEKPGARYIGKWNWGAAFLYPFWLMTHRRVPLGIILFVASLIPFVNFIGIVCLFYFGLKGNQIATNCGRYHDEMQFVAVQNAWRNWAFGFLIVGVLLGIIGAIFGAVPHPHR